MNMLPVAILAGGLATRLRPATDRIPKALVEVNGEPFLAHQLRLLAASGIVQVTLCAGYLGEMIQAYAGDGGRFGLALSYSFDGPELRGTAGAIAQARNMLGESFFVLYGDSYLPCDYTQVQQAFEEGGKPALMTVYRNCDQGDLSNVDFEAGQILAYDKNVRTRAMQYIDYGLGVFHGGVFDDIPDHGVYHLTDTYRRLLSEGRLAGTEVKQRFYEVGSFVGIRELAAYLKK